MCWLPPIREAGGQGSNRDLVYTVMLGASSDIFCSTACLKESCLKTVPTEVFLTRTTCSQVSPGPDLPGKGVPWAPQESRSCCPQEEERRESCGQAALLLSKSTGSGIEPASGTGKGRGGVGRGLVPFACPSGEPLAWLPPRNLLARQGLNPGEQKRPRPA